MKHSNFSSQLDLATLGFTRESSIAVNTAISSRRKLFKSFAFSIVLVGLSRFNKNVSAATLQSDEEGFWKYQKSTWDREQARKKKLQITSAQKLLEPLAKMMGFHSQNQLDIQTNKEVIQVFHSVKNNSLFENEYDKRNFIELRDETVQRIQTILNAKKSEEWKRNVLSEYFHHHVLGQYLQALDEYKKYEVLS